MFDTPDVGGSKLEVTDHWSGLGTAEAVILEGDSNLCVTASADPLPPWIQKGRWKQVRGASMEERSVVD